MGLGIVNKAMNHAGSEEEEEEFNKYIDGPRCIASKPSITNLSVPTRGSQMRKREERRASLADEAQVVLEPSRVGPRLNRRRGSLASSHEAQTVSKPSRVGPRFNRRLGLWQALTKHKQSQSHRGL